MFEVIVGEDKNKCMICVAQVDDQSSGLLFLFKKEKQNKTSLKRTNEPSNMNCDDDDDDL